LPIVVEFKDKDNTEMSLHCISCGRRQRAEEQIITMDVPYRNDEQIVHTGRYSPYLRKMEFAYRDKAKTPEIMAWLTGIGKLRTSQDVGGYFKAHVVKGYDVEKFSKNYDSFQTVFKINPGFFYLDSGDTPLILTAPATLTNLGTMYSEPYIKITGTGDVDLTIGSTTYSFTAIDGYIEVDSELMYVYKDTVNAGDKMVGDFPVFNIGDNAISWTGTVTEVRIIPRWREL